MSRIKAIAFDADDTLWVNEPYYQETEKRFCALMKKFAEPETVSAALLKTETGNLCLYGFGAKGFTLSMIETAVKLSNGNISADDIGTILSLGKNLMDIPIQLLGDIKAIVSSLKKKFKVILATKGDLIDQQRKLGKSGLDGLFDHVEIMSDKKEEDYRLLLQKLNIAPAEFMMVGNSYKSDILPVIAAGGKAVYIPYSVTWQHEASSEIASHPDLYQMKEIGKILRLEIVAV
jgi:putative hydrolase of the HAD superfamily